MGSAGTRHRRAGRGRNSVFRWECPCGEPAVLLATYTPDGRINIKARDRYWHVFGQVQAICPRCGAEHLLDLRGTGPAEPAPQPPALGADPSRPPRGAR